MTVWGPGAVHFMGVGGAGMCALAELVARQGGAVSGCDLKPGPTLDNLRALGLTVHEGHDPSHLADVGSLVVSAAVPAAHPEVQAAKERGIPVMKRAKALGACVNGGRVLAVAGTHGKTSTSAMAAELLRSAGMDPTGIVGGRVAAWGGHLLCGGGDLYVVEADEFDRSFLELEPLVSVVTNVEADHLDTYGTLDGVMEAFRTFVDSVPSEGRIIVCADDHGASRLLPEVGERGFTYGTSAGARMRAVDIRSGSDGTRFRVVEDGREAGELLLMAPGLHNLRNALGAAAAARYFGVEWRQIRDCLASYAGVGRRFERLGAEDGVDIVDDYAHHPTEIESALAATRELFPDRRLVAVFQPHLYSRTRDFAAEFGRALGAADVAFVTDIFPAREEPIPGVTGELVATAVDTSSGTEVHYHPILGPLPEVLSSFLKRGDVLLTLGAGSIEEVGPRTKVLLGGGRNA
ncbi:MAG: UDP-N-acetylmuramate--L-alanine ligase [Gemmatimonadota bacterium]|nr:MAG: UDP-N-acetylmuramate--L-alanine ligase [Gemmatimonadota bacterium]